MSDEKRRTSGITIWLNDLQFHKLSDVEEDFAEVFGRALTHGEAIMAASLITKAFIAFFTLGSRALEMEKLDFNQVINFEHLQKAGAQIPRDQLENMGEQIERVFVQLDALGFLRSGSKIKE